ncbi:DUF3576 domain-containing protein [Roseitranquillus sediminis]|uniref:DUF3576 domain-containing protein n=1 Tax=Roseitranquillus sediminis TaxID=2809051 RepID=UPI001D0C00A2|nr:DUF3576 domain-containing protein [Roseitranquillus sediminis]MBM9596271.1 DUF3576 domain-containing protein [Roseitranquillus sediminis]
MTMPAARRALCLIAAMASLSACGTGSPFDRSPSTTDSTVSEGTLRQRQATPYAQIERRQTIFDLFGGGPDANVTVAVNRHIWNAALEVLDFLPVEAADPFSGVIVMGYGTPPGSGQAYRATVYVRDPALDARALNVALQTRSGPASLETVRAVEDAILTRARQLRIRDSRL